MKTLIKKLKFGILLTGFVVLASCCKYTAVVSVSGINAIQQTIPSLAKNATKYTGNRISKYFNNASATKNGNELNVKKLDKEVRNRRFIPLTIGVAGARLVSSNSR